MRKVLFARYFVALVLLALGQSLCAQTVADGVMIHANFMDRDMSTRTIMLKGDVQIIFKENHLSCDQAVQDEKKQQIIAEGHVVLFNAKTHIEADKIIFNYKTDTGLIYNGYVQSGQVVFQGDTVEKTGPDHYIATQAEFTACETCPPGWSFSGRKIDAEIGGYARITRPIFHVGGIPVMILPSLVMPLKSARQSGVLVPSLAVSKKGGIALTGIYFWAIDRSQDMTLSARWYQLRGYKFLDEYRYVLSPDSKGELQGAWMSDRVLQTEYPTLQTHGSLDRWFVDYEHHQEFPGNYVQRLNLRDVSDLRYTRDFPDEVKGHGDPALENKASITKTSENHYASIEADLYTNLLKFYPVQRNDDSVHRVPELRYSLKEQRLGEWGPTIRMDVDYTNFARGSYNYDDLARCNNYYNPKNQAVDPSYCKNINDGLVPIDQGRNINGEIQRDGKFDPATDLWRTGERLDVMPTISYPFQIARMVDILPSITYRETQYRFNVDPDQVPEFNNTAARRYLQTDILAKTEFSRIFGDLQNPQSQRWKHSIEPEIGYSQIPWRRTPNHPFFGTFDGFQYSRQFDPISDSDISFEEGSSTIRNPNTGVQFDYNDRTFERRVVTYGLTNRLTRKIWNDGTPDYRTIALFSLGQSYDLKEAQRADQQFGSHPWSMIDGLLDIRLDHFETYTTVSVSPYREHYTDVSSRVRTMLTPKNFLEVSYTRNWILDSNYKAASNNSESRSYGLGAGFVSQYADLVGHIEYTDLTHDPTKPSQILGWGYELNIRPPGNCWVIHFKQLQVLGGDPSYGGSISFNFGGEVDRGRPQGG